MARDYDPILVHDRNCPDAPAGTLALPARAVAHAHPHARPHRCLSGAVARANGTVAIEHVVFEPHEYVASTIMPEDATRALCRTCRGTHGSTQGIPQPSELIVVTR